MVLDGLMDDIISAIYLINPQGRALKNLRVTLTEPRLARAQYTFILKSFLGFANLLPSCVRIRWWRKASVLCCKPCEDKSLCTNFHLKLSRYGISQRGF